MSVILTTRINGLPDGPDEDAIVPTLHAVGARHLTPAARSEHYPVIGAVALDAMAAIAGPAGAPDYERAWNAAFEIVVGAIVAGASDGKRRAAA